MTWTRLAFVAMGLLAGLAAAKAKEGVKNPHWLSADEVAAIIASEPPPPAPGSDAEKVDMQKEIDAQNSRDAARIAESNRDNGYSIELFTGIVGPHLTRANNPEAFQFFDRVNREIGEVVKESKSHWKRPRPYQAHPDVIHALFEAGDYSYPSGHSTNSFTFAVILGEMFPDKAAAFLARAHQIAQSRVDAGVHYTTDIQEGEVVGRELAKELLAKPEFEQEMKAAEADIAAKK